MKGLFSISVIAAILAIAPAAAAAASAQVEPTIETSAAGISSSIFLSSLAYRGDITLLVDPSMPVRVIRVNMTEPAPVSKVLAALGLPIYGWQH